MQPDSYPLIALKILLCIGLCTACTRTNSEDFVIAFTGEQDKNNRDIFLMTADGSNRKRLTTHPGEDWSPVWSPDGTRLAFISDRNGQSDLYLINLDGSQLTRLTSHAARDEDPAWSPDSQHITFVSKRDATQQHPYNTEIYLLNIKDSEIKRLTEHVGEDSSPSWSPENLFEKL